MNKRLEQIVTKEMTQNTLQKTTQMVNKNIKKYWNSLTETFKLKQKLVISVHG